MGSTEILTILLAAEGGIITLLLGAMGYFYIMDRRNITKRIDKQDETINQLVKFMKQQQVQITDTVNKMNKTVELIGINQENDAHRMEFMEKLILQRTGG